METKKCPICGAEFETNFKKKMFCSKECKLKHKYEYQKRYRAKNKERVNEWQRAYTKTSDEVDEYSGRYQSPLSAVAERRPRHKNTEKKLVADDKAAKEKGMTYGQYKAMLYLESLKKEKENE